MGGRVVFVVGVFCLFLVGLFVWLVLCVLC